VPSAPEPTEIFTVTRGIVALPLRTPTLPPATRTNCLILGEGDEVLVVDPGSPWRMQQQALAEHLTGRRVVGILVTHHHGDHVGGVPALVEATGAPVHAHAGTAERVEAVDAELADGDRIPFPGAPGRYLEAVFTPGHTPGHLCYRDSSSGVVLAGDMVAGTGTVVVAPPEGDMVHYLASLERMQELDASKLVPAHGPVIEHPADLLSEYTRHRLWREGRILAALSDKPAGLMAITRRAYTDVSVTLHALASYSARAHLDKLVSDDLAEGVSEKRWRRR